MTTEYLTMQQAAEKFPGRGTDGHVHWKTVDRWIREGVDGVTLRSTRIGGCVYVSPDDITAFIKELSRRKNGALSPAPSPQASS